jgi:hypothetical protein
MVGHSPVPEGLQRRETGKTRCTLLENILRFRYKQCLDPRDIIYSLLSISQVSLALEVDYDITLADLALRVLRVSGPDVCLCSAKIVNEVLLYLEELRDDSDYPCATLYLPSSLPVSGSLHTCCGGIVSGRIARKHFAPGSTRFDCLGCSHKGSIIRPANGHRDFRHEHLILVRHDLHEPTSLWYTYWIPLNKDSSYYESNAPLGPLDSVRVPNMNKDRSTSFQVSSTVFADWVEPAFECVLVSREHVATLDGQTGDKKYNPRWTLLSREKHSILRGR